MKPDEKVSLATLARGAAIERFDDELLKVLDNILDPNTAEVTREITLKVKIKPNLERAMAAVDVVCSSKIAPPIATSTVFFIGKDRFGKVYAFEHNPEQGHLQFDKTPAPPRAVESPSEE